MRSPALDTSECICFGDGEENAEFPPLVTEETPPTDHIPCATNTPELLTTQSVSPGTTNPDLLHQATSAASQYNQERHRVSIIGRSNNGAMLPISSCGFRLAPHRLGGNFIYPLLGSTVPEPGPTQNGGLSVLAEQLPIWDEEDLPVDVFVRDIGANGFLLTGADQVLCLILRNTEANEAQISATMQFHLGLDFQTVLYQIVANIRAIPQDETQRLIHSHLFDQTTLNISNTASSEPSLTGIPSLTVTAQSPSLEDTENTPEASELSVELPNLPGVAPYLSTEEPTGTITENTSTAANGPPYVVSNPFVAEQNQPALASGQSVEETSGPTEETSHHTDKTPSKLPSTQSPLNPNLTSGLPFVDTGGPVAVVPNKPGTNSGFQHESSTPKHPKTRRAPRKGSMAKKPRSFEWTDKNRAFVVYYVEYGYLPSQVRRMFKDEFGIAPTHEEIRNMLDLVDEQNGKVKTRQQLVGDVNSGAVVFDTLHCIPSNRAGMEPLKKPGGAYHRNFVSFFHRLGIDRAMVHEIFEMHNQGTITADQLEEIWKNPSTREKSLRMEAERHGWFEYIQEGKIGYPESPAVQKSIRIALARIRAAHKKETFLGEFERQCVSTDVNESTEGEQGGEKEAEWWEEGNTLADKAAEPIEEKADAGKQGKRIARDLRPQEDRERSRSPN